MCWGAVLLVVQLSVARLLGFFGVDSIYKNGDGVLGAFLTGGRPGDAFAGGRGDRLWDPAKEVDRAVGIAPSP